RRLLSMSAVFTVARAAAAPCFRMRFRPVYRYCGERPSTVAKRLVRVLRSLMCVLYALGIDPDVCPVHLSRHGCTPGGTRFARPSPAINDRADVRSPVNRAVSQSLT